MIYKVEMYDVCCDKCDVERPAHEVAKKDQPEDLSTVKVSVNLGRNRADFRPEFLLHSEKVVAVVIGDQVDRQTKVTESPRTTNSVQIGLSCFREIKVDHNINRLDVNSASKKVG